MPYCFGVFTYSSRYFRTSTRARCRRDFRAETLMSRIYAASVLDMP